MISIYTFNENTAANVYDYSGNGNDATSISNFAIVAGELGYAGSFNGTTTDLNFGNIANVTGTLSIFCKLKVTTGAALRGVLPAGGWASGAVAGSTAQGVAQQGALQAAQGAAANVATKLGTTVGKDALINAALDPVPSDVSQK